MSATHSRDQPGGGTWVAVNSHPHREQVAVENLRRQDFSCYCPVVRRRRSHARRVDEVLRPLFPGYLFVQLSPARDRWRPILSTYGVRTLVCSGDRPSTIDDRFISALKMREVDGAIVRPHAPYRVGQKVQVVSGAFEGIVATIIALEERERLGVLFEVMNRTVRARVDGAMVAPT